MSMISLTSFISLNDVVFGISILFLTWLTALYIRYRKIYHDLKHIDIAPGAVPILVHTWRLLFHFETSLDYLSEMTDKFGLKPCLFGGVLSSPYVLLNNPDCIEHVLKTNFDNYVKGEYFSEITFDLLGHGIFNSDGEIWRIQRKTAANIFNVKNFKDFVSKVFADEMLLLEKKLDKISSSSENNLVDIQDLLFRFTLDGFAKIGFHVDLNCMMQDKPVPFVAAFDRAQTVMDFRFMIPFWKFSELFNYKNIHRDFSTIKKFCHDIVKSRKEEAQDKFGNDLLSMFMNLKDEDGEPLFTDRQLADLVLNFIVAGRDTTAQALSWTFYRLSIHPKEKETLVQEIRDVLGKSQSDRPTYEQIKEMKFAKAVFFETLRLHPSVPKNCKRSVQDDYLPDGTFIPAGTNVAWSPYGQGRNEKVWGPDAKNFKPSRWLEMETQPSPYQYPVFHAGPRTCLGKTMAEIEGVYVLTSILNKFDIEVVQPDKVHYGNSLTLPMREGLLVKVTKRSQ